MVMFDDHIFIYGGLGCDKYISWAKYSLKTQEWTISKI